MNRELDENKIDPAVVTRFWIFMVILTATGLSVLAVFEFFTGEIAKEINSIPPETRQILLRFCILIGCAVGMAVIGKVLEFILFGKAIKS